jgi:hypothetical protein
MVVGDTYSFSTTAPTWAAADVATAVDALKASPKNAALLYVAGPSSKAQSDTVVSSVGGYVARKKFVRLLMEAVDIASGQTEAAWMTAISTDWSTASNDRLVVGAGAARVSSAVSGIKFRRNIGHLALVRAGRRNISRDIGAAEDGSLCPQYEGTNTTGPLSGAPVDTVYHDEGLNPGLNDNRFMTVTTIEGLTGYFVTNPAIMTGATSDFDLLQLGRQVRRYTVDHLARGNVCHLDAHQTVHFRKEALFILGDGHRTDHAADFRGRKPHVGRNAHPHSAVGAVHRNIFSCLADPYLHQNLMLSHYPGR